MPAEWEPHRGVWMSWPHREESWPGRFEPVPAAYARLVSAIAKFEPVHLNVGSGCGHIEQASRLLKALDVSPERVHFHPIPTNDAWCRDHGPIFVEDRNGAPAVLDWGFNAWGGKYEPWDLDDAVPARVAEELGLPRVSPGMTLEGGSIDVNGRGTLLTTESCLLNPNRNPDLSRDQIEAALARYLGAYHVIWLGEGIAGDDTDGHIDDLARFVNETTVVAAAPDDPADPDAAILADNLSRLRASTDQDGRSLTVVELPTPDGVTIEGEPVPASYANFYIANGAVIAPVFRHRNDERALSALARCFPGRAIVPVDCTDLIWGLGAVHCLTQQWPEPPGRPT
jgi:agmatine deiminase